MSTRVLCQPRVTEDLGNSGQSSSDTTPSAAIEHERVEDMSDFRYTAFDRERNLPESRGADEERSEGERDRSRIVHSAAFRRLYRKTQLLWVGSGDFYRTRLTHSLEVAQIGKGIALRVGRKLAGAGADDLRAVQELVEIVEAVCLAHDIGVPPFGHEGEKALNELMSNYGGFEANAQNLRILCRLEVRKQNQLGLNLTRATLDGLLKYPWPLGQPSSGGKGWYDNTGDDLDLVSWIRRGSPDRVQSLECRIMNWADELAYSVHDLEDGIWAGMISRRLVEKAIGEIKEKAKERLSREYPAVGKRIGRNTWEEQSKAILELLAEVEQYDQEHARKAKRKEMTSALINEAILATKDVKTEPTAPSIRYRYEFKVDDDGLLAKHALLNASTRLLMIENPRVVERRQKSKDFIGKLFGVFMSEPDCLPQDFREMCREAAQTWGDSGKARVVCDYIAGMTDDSIQDVYAQIFMPYQRASFRPS